MPYEQPVPFAHAARRNGVLHKVRIDLIATIFEIPRGGLGVALAGLAQDSAEQLRTAPLALREDPSSLSEVDLELVPRGSLHASEGDLRRVLQTADEAFDRVIGGGEPVFDHQILIDPLGGTPGLKPLLDDLAQRNALAGSLRLGPDRQNGWFCRVCSQTQIASDGLTVEAKLTGDLASGPALGRQRDNGML